MNDERAVAPEQAMTPSEREAHPILTGAGEFAGGITTPESALLTGMTMGPAPAIIARPLGGIFSAQMLRGAYQEWPEFRQAVADQRWSEVERLATHMVLGATMAAIGARQAVKGETPYERYSETGRQFAELKRQYESKTGIETNGVGLYNKIRETLATHQAVLQADGARTIQDAINADKSALMNTNRGSISTSEPVAEAAKKLVDTDYSMKPAERTLFNKLANAPELTLEQAKQLRTAFGRAAASARRSNNAAGNAVFTAAYNSLGEGMSARIQELQGTTRPFTHYNNQFKASFELEDGIAGEMMESLRGKDAQASIPKLAKFADADLSEIQQQMRTTGNPHLAKALETAQRDAKALNDANGAVGGRYLQSVYRLFLQNPKQAWPGLVVMAAGHGIGLPFPVPQIMGAAATGAHLGMRAKAAAGDVGTRLRGELPPEYFRTRTQAEAPETFTYKDPDEGWQSGATPSEVDPQAAKANAVKGAMQQKKARK